MSHQLFVVEEALVQGPRGVVSSKEQKDTRVGVVVVTSESRAVFPKLGRELFVLSVISKRDGLIFWVSDGGRGAGSAFRTVCDCD